MLKVETEEETRLAKAKASEARTKADQADAEIRAKEELKNKNAIAQSDAEKLKAEEDAAAAEENAILKKQIEERKKFLKTALTDSEAEELVRLEGLANTGQSIEPGIMHRLADLREKKKVKK